MKRVINFIDFHNEKYSSEIINNALKIYSENFDAFKIPIYFENWTIQKDDSKYKNGIILTNKHSDGWSSTIIINDNFEYTLDSNSWLYLPRTLSEFISDVLREEDFELLFSKSMEESIFGKNNFYGNSL